MINKIQRQTTINTFLFFFLTFWAVILLVLSAIIYYRPPGKKVGGQKNDNKAKSIGKRPDEKLAFIESKKEGAEFEKIQTSSHYIILNDWARVIKIDHKQGVIEVEIDKRKLSFSFTPTTKVVTINQQTKTKKAWQGLQGLKVLNQGMYVKLTATRQGNELIKVLIKGNGE
ncbi:MAG: hypothetical protein GXP43_02710 [bacterium]|nr:hypothetical protein [bacterium]